MAHNTMITEAAILSITRSFESTAEVKALFLAGSYGFGIQDRFSDIDLVVVTSDPGSGEFISKCRAAIDQIEEVVLWRVHDSDVVRVSSITSGWLRLDIILVSPGQIESRVRDSLSRQGLRTLFDKERISEMLPSSTDNRPIQPCRTQWQFSEFIRILGLLPLTIGRENFLNAITGVTYLRNLLIDLMIAETAAPNKGGALNMHRGLTDAQIEILYSLTLPQPDRDSIIAANLRFAREYMPRGRTLATRLGIVWPESFEIATWRHLQDELAITPVYEVPSC